MIYVRECLPMFSSSSFIDSDKWLVKVSWLRKLVSVFSCVELDLISLECNEVSSHEF